MYFVGNFPATSTGYESKKKVKRKIQCNIITSIVITKENLYYQQLMKTLIIQSIKIYK